MALKLSFQLIVSDRNYIPAGSADALRKNGNNRLNKKYAQEELNPQPSDP
jgi:hypothetical protein